MLTRLTNVEHNALHLNNFWGEIKCVFLLKTQWFINSLHEMNILFGFLLCEIYLPYKNKKVVSTVSELLLKTRPPGSLALYSFQ